MERRPRIYLDGRLEFRGSSGGSNSYGHPKLDDLGNVGFPFWNVVRAGVLDGRSS